MRGFVARDPNNATATGGPHGWDALTHLCFSRYLRLDHERGGTLLAEFSGAGNLAGIRNLLQLGVNVASLYREGDPYFDIAKDSTALHVTAWRAWPAAVRELIARAAPVNALDAKGRTALSLAVKACVDSYWKDRRSPESVEALLRAGASVSGIEIPSGYDAVDELLRQYSGAV